MGTDGAALRADAEELAFDRVAVAVLIDFDREDFVEGVAQPLAGSETVERNILISVRHPEVGDAGIAEFPAEGFGDLPAGDAVADPELAHFRVGAAQREAVLHHRVGEERGVEVQTDVILFRPGDPVGEVFRPDFVAADLLLAGFGVERVQIEPLFARNQRQDFIDVAAELFRVAGPARIVAGHLNAAVQRAAVLETGDVVALPAVQADRDLIQPLECRLDVDAEFPIHLLRGVKHGSHTRFFLLC